MIFTELQVGIEVDLFNRETNPKVPNEKIFQRYH